MRFKLFGFKGSIDTRETVKEKKKKKTNKDEENTGVICMGYRTNNEFDLPSIKRLGPVDNSSIQASTSKPTHAAVNGNIPAGKPAETANVKVNTLFPTITAKKEVKTDSKGAINKSKLPEKETKTNDKTNKTKTTKTITKTNEIKSKPPQPPIRQDSASKKDVNQSKTQTIPAVNTFETPQYSEPIQIVAKSATNIQNPTQTSFQNGYSDEEDDNGTITFKRGKTASVNDEDNKKSTLIFMTESHDDQEDEEYYEDGEAYNTSVNYGKSANMDRNAPSGDYSNAATSIFFTGGDVEPTQRVRNFKYRDDDDNGSQTSA